MESDFARLYAWLDLRPECTLEEFKRAYRRRVAQLHPDRCEHPHRLSANDMPLSELTSLYSTATRFHRQHGRLPGASSRTRVPMHFEQAPSQFRDGPLAPQRRRGDLVRLPVQDAMGSHRRTTLAALVVFIVLVLMIVVEASLPASDEPPGSRGATVSQEASPSTGR